MIIVPPRYNERNNRFSLKSRTNFEVLGWIFMRISGVTLVVLVLGHLFVNLLLGEGIKAIDFAFVGGKWANPFWQMWDLTMLWLAMLHGANGMRTIINDYAQKDKTRVVLKMFLISATVLVVVLGTFVIFTFEPCPLNSPEELLPSFCFSN